MRSSCNGCRVLRKGCSEECTIRPCLQWIKTPESQAQATLFLAKFYGRTGLLNLIHAGPDYLRPAVFKSLLYEACGRIVSPIHGSVGLLWSGEWAKCQAAVEAVLAGKPIIVAHHSVPLNSCDIRHVSSSSADGLSEPRRKRSKSKRNKPEGGAEAEAEAEAESKRGSADFAQFLNPCHEYFWWNNNETHSSEAKDASVARRAATSQAGLDLTLALP